MGLRLNLPLFWVITFATEPNIPNTQITHVHLPQLSTAFEAPGA